MDPSPARGRRGNGLPSADWGALVDVDPRLSEALLSSLAGAGVAAFVEPALGSNAFTRAATLPDRPLDRLWVDPARADQARQVVGAEVADLTTLLAELEPGATAHGLVHPVPRSAASRVLTPPPLPGPPIGPPRSGPSGPARPGGAAGPPPAPGAPGAPPAGPPPDRDADSASSPGGPGQDPSAPDLAPTGATPGGGDPGAGPDDLQPGGVDPDEEFRRIVEGFSREADSPVPPWPVSEDVDPPSRRRFPTRPEPAPEPPPESRRRRRSDQPEGALPDWVEPEAVEDEGHYVPPPPPPVPRLAPRKIAAAAAVLVGVVLMFAPQLLLQDRTAFVGMLGVLLTAGGAAALIYLMRDAPPTDSGPDDGAVV